MVGEPALNREQGLRIVLPGFPRIDAFLANPQHIVELEGSGRVEDAPAIGHNGFWSAIATDGVHQHREVVPLVLRRGDGGGEHHARKIFKDGDHIHGLGIWEQVLFNVSDISTPELMTPQRLEGHVQLRAPLAFRFLQSVELPIGGHDATTGRGTHLDALAQERGMDAVLSQQGVLLKFTDLVSDLKRRLARPLSRPGLLF